MNHLLIVEITPLNYTVAATGDKDDMVEKGIINYYDKKWQVVQQIHLHSPFNSNQVNQK